MIIELSKDDPIVKRALMVETSSMTEIGFIPGDEYGCKIYAFSRNGRVNMIGLHSRAYGCKKSPDTDSVVIKTDSPRIERVTLKGYASPMDDSGGRVPVEVEITDPAIIALIKTGTIYDFSLYKEEQ